MRRYRRNPALTYQQICQKWDQMIDEYGIRSELESKLRVLCSSNDIESFRSMFELLLSFGEEGLCEIFAEYPDGQIGLNLSLPCIRSNVSQVLFNLYEQVEVHNSLVWKPLYDAGKMLAIDSCIYEDNAVQNLVKTPSLFEKVVRDFSQMVPIVPTNGIKPFYIGKYEVTQALWYSVFSEVTSDYLLKLSKFKGSTRPVEQVSWYDCIDFCNLLSSLHGLKPAYKAAGEWDKNANGFRLPTEAEWEYCARAGENYKYSGSDNLDEVAWIYANSDTGNGKGTHGVGQKKPNAFGLYDMSGNVSELCWDGFYRSTDPGRVYRGGSWGSNAWGVHISNLDWNRGRSIVSHRENFIGFRLARNME